MPLVLVVAMDVQVVAEIATHHVQTNVLIPAEQAVVHVLDVVEDVLDVMVVLILVVPIVADNVDLAVEPDAVLVVGEHVVPVVHGVV